MARTLNNEILKNERRARLNGNGGHGRGQVKVKLSEIRKRKSSLQNWRKKADKFPRAVFMDSSDDESQGPTTGAAPPATSVQPSCHPTVASKKSEVDNSWKIPNSLGPPPETSPCNPNKKKRTSESNSSKEAAGNVQRGSSPDAAIDLDEFDDDSEVTTSNGLQGNQRSFRIEGYPNPPEVTDSSVPTEESNSDFDDSSLKISRRNLQTHKRKWASVPGEKQFALESSDSEDETPTERVSWGSSKDRTAKAGDHRCHYVTQKNRACRYVAVYNSDFCNKHLRCDRSSSLPNGSSDTSSGKRKGATLPVRSSESGSEIESVNHDSQNDEDPNEERPYRHKEFMELWSRAEDMFGVNTDEIENTRLVRGANYKVSPSDTDGQSKAQYGRLLPRAMKRLIHDVLEIQPHDVFLDIGHGIGNACLQAAFTAGCEARGIEVIEDRQSIAEAFRDFLRMRAEEDGGKRIVGKVDLRYGRLEDSEHHKFLTEGVTRAYVNNFNGVFAERSMKPNKNWFLDDYVAGIFASMAPGAILVTLHQINLGPTLNEANKRRRDHNLSESDNASFYEVDKVVLGAACDSVKWNQLSGNKNKVFVYKYKKLRQPSQPAGKTVFLCCNPTCRFAKESIPIDAVTTNEEGRFVMNTCSCKVTTKNLRRQGRKTYTVA